MKPVTRLLAAAGAVVLLPALAIAAPPTPSATTAPGNGQFNGQGYNHMNSGQAKGQPNQSCQTTGTPPGNAASDPGGGSPFGSTSNSGAHYAGTQPQNSRNTASVSQYDVACANQPH